MKNEFLVLTFYRFIPFDDPQGEVARHKAFFEGRRAAGRIYISSQGINAQMSGTLPDVEEYLTWLKQDARFEGADFKIDTYHENIFPRMTVKFREQLVALDHNVDPKKGGNYLSPQQWKETLESDEEFLLLDVRNQYEWEIGHFEGAHLPPLENFRDFPQYAEKLKELSQEKKKILMYCTGGIRCELYSAFLKEQGFENIYQLEGGVINYGAKEGKKHWKGKLFVFDDRLAINIGEEELPISQCQHCKLDSDMYYNCANMDCNALFLCCQSCIEIYKGCCSFSCTTCERLRPYSREGGNKPFCRKHLL